MNKKNVQSPNSKVLAGHHVPNFIADAVFSVDSDIEVLPQLPDPEDQSNEELDILMSHPKMKIFEVGLVQNILTEVMEQQSETKWDDVAGLQGPKAILNEIVIWPLLRPDIFKGLLSPPKGILLFGPPGNGKTMIGRLIASQSKATFFSISASSLTSKWIGDGEKLVRCLFQVARLKQPSVIFLDEIDSILSNRGESEDESTRRLKTEFLVQLEGCGTSDADKILVIGATNRPHELDPAARRRLSKRIYIPLPDIDGRQQMIRNLLKGENNDLNDQDILIIGTATEGYSGADIKAVCQEASYGPIRDVGADLMNIQMSNIRPIQLCDFTRAVKSVKPSVSTSQLKVFETWDEEFGCHLAHGSNLV